MEQDTTTEAAQKPRKMKKHLILAGVLLVIGFLILASGASLVYYNQLDTDNEGFVYSNIYHVNTTTYGFIAYMNPYLASTFGFLGMNNIAQIKYIARNLNPSKELFMGYATTRESEPYSRSFLHQFPTFWHWTARPYYTDINITMLATNGTGAPAALPQAQTFWLAEAHSTDTAVMTYVPQQEQHVWFIMNADGSNNITADIQIGFKSPILSVLPLILIPVGLLLLLIGVLLLRKKKDNQPKTP
jgi:hypothetical protein